MWVRRKERNVRRVPLIARESESDSFVLSVAFVIRAASSCPESFISMEASHGRRELVYVNGDERSSEFGQNETIRKVLSFIFIPRRVFNEMQRLGSERGVISMRAVQGTVHNSCLAAVQYIVDYTFSTERPPTGAVQTRVPL